MEHNRHGDQPGLEVMPEPELPQVVEGPVFEKPYDQGYNQNTHYLSSPSAYPPSSHPGWEASQSGPYQNGQPPNARTERVILGLKKKTFLLIFGPLLALLVIGLAVGLGVGLGLRNQGSEAATNPAPSPITCPAANGTTYDAGGDTTFSILCSIDYNSQSGTVDDIHETTNTVEDCISACDARNSCVGAGWGNFQGDTICWMKSSLGTPQEASSDWVFAIKQ
ncbi:hypothetical protein F5X99DRAFT_50227 [Biscogniauxia marginata]|nr:hypothetical protein F5X99DRAFT_50227 [Biscogniauxia marginata]